MPFSTRDIFYIYDDPVPYKKLKLYPIRMRDYMLFYTLATCLQLEKNSIPDVKIISMTYLEYLMSIQNEENNLLYFVDGLLKLCLGKKDDEKFEIKYGVLDDKKPAFEIDGEIYNSDDFDVIREIIAEQNYVELADETIQKEVRDKMEETRRFKQKMGDEKPASLEDQIIAVAVYTGWELDKIYDMTIRKFTKALMRANHIITSTMILSASFSGMVQFKDKSILKSWLANLDSDDKFKDTTISVDEMQGQVDFSSAKK